MSPSLSSDKGPEPSISSSPKSLESRTFLCLISPPKHRRDDVDQDGRRRTTSHRHHRLPQELESRVCRDQIRTPNPPYSCWILHLQPESVSLAVGEPAHKQFESPESFICT